VQELKQLLRRCLRIQDDQRNAEESRGSIYRGLRSAAVKKGQIVRRKDHYWVIEMKKFFPVVCRRLLFCAMRQFSKTGCAGKSLCGSPDDSMPNVKGRSFIWMWCEAKRLFVAGLENGSLRSGRSGRRVKWSKSVPILRNAGVAYVPSSIRCSWPAETTHAARISRR